MSEDGANCLWDKRRNTTCAATIAAPPASITPLVCGDAHAALYNGSTGYDTPGHWCNEGREACPAIPAGERLGAAQHNGQSAQHNGQWLGPNLRTGLYGGMWVMGPGGSGEQAGAVRRQVGECITCYE